MLSMLAQERAPGQPILLLLAVLAHGDFDLPSRGTPEHGFDICRVDLDHHPAPVGLEPYRTRGGAIGQAPRQVPRSDVDC